MRTYVNLDIFDFPSSLLETSSQI